jgi:hypothetical protein
MAVTIDTLEESYRQLRNLLGYPVVDGISSIPALRCEIADFSPSPALTAFQTILHQYCLDNPDVVKLEYIDWNK